MAIKDKDGSVYKLTGTNPIMRTQEQWDKKRMILINMKGWKSEVVSDERNPVEKFKTDFNVVEISEELKLFKGPEPPQTTVIKAKEFIDDINTTKTEEPVELNLEPRMARLIRERGVEYHCAPATGMTEHKDELYDFSHKTIQYGDKYVFDAIVVDQSDLELQFWCVRVITINSIIYRKERGERWWRVRDTEPKSGGYLVSALVSDSNPDFS